MIMVERKIGGSAGIDLTLLNARLPLSQTLPFYILSPHIVYELDSVRRSFALKRHCSGLFVRICKAHSTYLLTFPNF